MKTETKLFIENRISELEESINGVLDIPQQNLTGWDLERMSNYKTEMVAYLRILKMEVETSVVTGNEFKSAEFTCLQRSEEINGFQYINLFNATYMVLEFQNRISELESENNGFKQSLNDILKCKPYGHSTFFTPIQEIVEEALNKNT